MVKWLRWIAAVVVFAALAVAVVVASTDDGRRNGPIPTQQGDPGDPSSYPLPQVSAGG